MASATIATGSLSVVFFDVGQTLGTVASEGDTIRLDPFPSSVALLDTMGRILGLRIGIISNTPDNITTDDLQELLAGAGLLTMLDDAAIVTSGTAGFSKPDRRIYEFAAAQVGVPVGRCLYIGEDPVEVAGAQQAGMAGLLKPNLPS